MDSSVEEASILMHELQLITGFFFMSPSLISFELRSAGLRAGLVEWLESEEFILEGLGPEHYNRWMRLLEHGD